MKNSFAAMTLAILSSSCTPAFLTKSNETNLRKVHVGQSADEVASILGEPDQKVAEGDDETWSYSIVSENLKSSYPYLVRFRKGAVQLVQPNSAARQADELLREQRTKATGERCSPLLVDCSKNGAPPIR